MNRKIWLTLIVFSFLTAAPVFANGGTEDAEDVKQAVSPPGVFPIVEEKITITAFMPAGGGMVEDFQDNDFTRYIEEKTNILIDIEAAENAVQKRNILLASGDYPDVFINGAFSKAEQQVYGSQGIFIPLNNLIERYGVNTREVFAAYPRIEANFTMPSGDIYSLPNINDCFHCSLARKMWIYQPWLDTLGLAAPTTTEEFKQVLIAFRDRDPNGNGLRDEIPLSGAVNGWNTDVHGFIMNSFIYIGENGMSLEGGRITASYVQPAWREGLRYLNELYDEGLLSGDAFIQDGSQYTLLGENPDAVILGAGPGGFMGSFTNLQGESGRWLEYKTVPALEGPEGVRFASYFPNFGYVSWTITDRAANPEAAFRLGDAFYEKDFVYHNLLGREGIDWAWAEEGELGINGLPGIWKPLVGRNEIGKTSWWDQRGPYVFTRAERLGRVNTGEESLALELILFEETRDKLEPYQVSLDRIIPPLAYGEDAAAEVVEIGTALDNYVAEMTARFIIGDADIEADWDDYLAEFERIGLDRYIELMQEAFDSL